MLIAPFVATRLDLQARTCPTQTSRGGGTQYNAAVVQAVDDAIQIHPRKLKNAVSVTENHDSSLAHEVGAI